MSLWCHCEDRSSPSQLRCARGTQTHHTPTADQWCNSSHGTDQSLSAAAPVVREDQQNPTTKFQLHMLGWLINWLGCSLIVSVNQSVGRSVRYSIKLIFSLIGFFVRETAMGVLYRGVGAGPAGTTAAGPMLEATTPLVEGVLYRWS